MQAAIFCQKKVRSQDFWIFNDFQEKKRQKESKWNELIVFTSVEF